MRVATVPKFPITISLFFIICFSAIQFNASFLSDFTLIEGEIVKYEFEEKIIEFDYVPKDPIRETTLVIWVNDSLNHPIKIPLEEEDIGNLSTLNKTDYVKIWVDNKNRVMQLIIDQKTIIEYNWFFWPTILFALLGFLYLVIYYRVLNEDCTNINSWSDLWGYYFGSSPLIMKSTNKPFDPNEDVGLW